jgi:hypothetical protein
LITARSALWGTAYTVNGMTQAPAYWIAGARPDGISSSGVDGRVTVAAWGSTRVEQLLGRGDWLVRGIGLLVGALALRPVLLSICSGRPFARGNARRIAVVAGTVAVVGIVAPLLPEIAGQLVLERTGLARTGAFAAVPGVSPEQLLVAALVLVVAAAFRAGETMARDVDGLV